MNTVSKTLSDETLNRIIQIESAGNLHAKAPTSSALGLFQFLNGTWLDTVKKHSPTLFDGRSQAEVLALRVDPKVGIDIGARFTEDNARGLGAGYSDGDLYLAHFLGLGSARKFLRAAPGASAEALAGAAAVRANHSILAGKTAGQVRAWAQASMINRWNKAGKTDWIAKYYPHAEVDEQAGVKVENADGHIDDPHAGDDPPDAAPEAPPPVVPAPIAPVPANSAVKGDLELWNVQRRLKEMNYNPGGLDGKWGGMIAGAISGFVNDRKMNIGAPTSLDMFHDTQEELKAELGRAESESFKRPVSAERANADPAKVEKTAPEVVPVKLNRNTGIIGSITAFFVAAGNWFSQSIGDAWNFFTGHKDDVPTGMAAKAWEHLQQTPGWVWLLLVAVGFVFVAFNSHKGVAAITKSVQTGDRA